MPRVTSAESLGSDPGELTAEERERYAWQLDVRGFGEEGQRRLRAATVFVSRIGGVGGAVVRDLAAAGVGRLALAHAGAIRRDDLNRQTLMTTERIGELRTESAVEFVRRLNPNVVVETFAENVTDENSSSLVRGSDVIVSAAPRFQERLAMNRAAVGQGTPLVDCAMYELEARLTTVLPGRSACLNCLYPELPDQWNRRFPVIGAVASMIGSLAAMEAIKLITGLGTPAADRICILDLREMRFQSVGIARSSENAVCRSAPPKP